MSAAARTAARRPRRPGGRTRSARTPARSPGARSSASPASNSSRGNGLAGATTATRSPGAQAAGLQHHAYSSHLVGDALVLVAARRSARSRSGSSGRQSDESGAGSGSPPGAGMRRRLAKRSLARRWRAIASSTRVQRDLLAFDRVHERLERRRVAGAVGAAQETRVAAGGDGGDERLLARRGRPTIPFMSRSSVKTTPSNPRSSRSRPVTIGGDSVARPLLVERGHQQVPGHDARDAGRRWPPGTARARPRAAGRATGRAPAGRGASRRSSRRARGSACRTPPRPPSCSPRMITAPSRRRPCRRAPPAPGRR